VLQVEKLWAVNRPPLQLLLEEEAEVGFELPDLVAFVLNEPEGVDVVDVQHRVTRYRMIEHIRRIHPNHKALGLGDSNGFAHSSVEKPGTWKLHRRPSKRTPTARQRILQNDLVGFRIGHGLQSAKRFQAVGHCAALRIGNTAETVAEETTM